MKHILLAAAAIAAAAPAAAQTLSPPVIIVVDMNQVVNTSVAGRGAAADIQGRIASLQARRNTLSQQLQAEQSAARNAVQAKTLTGPALDAKSREIQQHAQNAQSELENGQRQLSASNDYVLQQINDASQPIISQIMRERGAQIVLARGATLQTTASIDVTNDVIARLNTALPRVNTNAPAQGAATSQPAAQPARRRQ